VLAQVPKRLAFLEHVESGHLIQISGDLVSARLSVSTWSELNPFFHEDFLVLDALWDANILAFETGVLKSGIRDYGFPKMDRLG